MEDLCHRFPHVAKMIFNDLDDQSLIKSIEANRELDDFLSNDRIYWTRVLAIYKTNFILFKDSWRKNLHRVPVVRIKELAIAAYHFFKYRQSRLELQWSPLHIAAHNGSLELYKDISRKCGCINHVGDEGVTAIHIAANTGHLEIVTFIINNLPAQMFFGDQRHNPGRADGLTPLHFAALNGHFKTCAFIIKLLTNKNPGDKTGYTPLHCAAQKGQIRIYKLIVEYLVDKNPADNYGWTPLHVASFSNQLEPIKLIMCQVQNKNPVDIQGFTPLQVAIELSHLEVVKLFVGHLDVKIVGDGLYTSLHSAARYGNLALCKVLIKHKNCTDRNGWTPLHYAAINGHFAVCELLSEYFVEKRSFNNVWTLGHFAGTNGNTRLGQEMGKDLKNMGPKTNHGITPLSLMALNLSQSKEFLKRTYDGVLVRTGSWEGTMENPMMKPQIAQKSHDLSFQQSMVAPYFLAVTYQLIYQLLHLLQ